MTMRGLLLIDLDDIMANLELRRRRAEARLNQMLQPLKFLDPDERERAFNSLFYTTAFFYDPALLTLDTLMPGIPTFLDKADDYLYRVVIFTSRPAIIREQTIAWLVENDVLDCFQGRNAHLSGYTPQHEVIMKDEAFLHDKTPLWKGGLAATVAAMWRAPKVIYVDNEQKNLDEAVKRVKQPLAVYTSINDVVFDEDKDVVEALV